MSNLSFLNTIVTRTHFFFKATRAAFVSAVPNEGPSEDSRIFSTLSMPSALQTRIACSARSSSRPRSQTANASQQVCRIFTVTFSFVYRRVYRWTARPWYKPESGGLQGLVDTFAVMVGYYDFLPSRQFKSEGYRIEELVSSPVHSVFLSHTDTWQGPIPFEQCKFQPVNAHSRAGC